MRALWGMECDRPNGRKIQKPQQNICYRLRSADGVPIIISRALRRHIIFSALTRSSADWRSLGRKVRHGVSSGLGNRGSGVFIFDLTDNAIILSLHLAMLMWLVEIRISSDWLVYNVPAHPYTEGADINQDCNHLALHWSSRAQRIAEWIEESLAYYSS